MRKILFLLTFVLSGFLIAPAPASAQDIWAYEDTDSRCSVYVDDNTIKWNAERTNLSVTTKEVQNNHLIRKVKWNIDWVGNEWRYETSRMKGGHDVRLTPGSWADCILQICKNY